MSCALITSPIAKLRPVTYYWKDQTHDQKKQIGLIAQEAQKVIPELVETDGKSGMLSVNYQALVPVMIKALDQQQALIKKQEARIAALEKRHAPVLSSNTMFLALGLSLFGLFAAWCTRQQRAARQGG